MTILGFLLLVVVVGVLVWLAIRFVPMPSEFQRALPVLAILLLVLILLVHLFGFGIPDAGLPRLR